MLKRIVFGMIISMLVSTFLSAAEKSDHSFDKESEKKNIAFCLGQISRATSLDVIRLNQNQVIELLKAGEKPLLHHLRFLHWQVHDQRLIVCLESDPLWNRKVEVYQELLSSFRVAGYSYKPEQDDCIVS